MTAQSAAAREQQVVWTTPPRLDLRFEVTHRPPSEMWDAMRTVTPGMASSGQDPLVRELEDLAAHLTGKEAALFLPTATNATALTFLNQDLRGQQVIMEARCHIFWSERLHVSALAGAAPRLVGGDKFGWMDPDVVREVMNESAYGHAQRTGLICLENSHNVCGGTVLSAEQTTAMADLAHEFGARLFLDGVRVFNSAVALGLPVDRLTAPADYVVISLNKGLGAPMGSLLCTDAQFISGVKIWAARMGISAVHKAGLFAAAGLVALRKMVGQLQADHQRARRTAEAISEMDGLSVDLDTVQTNLVRVDTSGLKITALDFAKLVARHGLAVHVLEPHAFKLAFCYDIDDSQTDAAIEVLQRGLSDVS
jgi:threonine aldolase